MTAKIIYLLGFIVSAGLYGCASTEQTPQAGTEPVEKGRYSSISWKSLIPPDCDTYFDGCNNCRRNPGTGAAACTRKSCATYTKPYCLDDNAAAAAAQTLAYQCEGGNRFTLSYGKYRAKDRQLKLNQDKVIFSDQQTRMATSLTRVPSASGQKYSDGKLVLFSEGNEAFVHRGEKILYRSCVRGSN